MVPRLYRFLADSEGIRHALVAMNRGYLLRHFYSEEEAVTWLQGRGGVNLLHAWVVPTFSY